MQSVVNYSSKMKMRIDNYSICYIKYFILKVIAACDFPIKLYNVPVEYIVMVICLFRFLLLSFVGNFIVPINYK